MVAYCPECGSQVAPENTFCAYCGMNLTPLITDVSQDEASAASSSTSSDAETSSEASGAQTTTENVNAAPSSNFSPEQATAQAAEPKKIESPISEESFLEDLPAAQDNKDADDAAARSDQDYDAKPATLNAATEPNVLESKDESAHPENENKQTSGESPASFSFDWEAKPKAESNQPFVQEDSGKLQRLKTAAEISPDIKSSIKQNQSSDSPISESEQTKASDLESPPPPAFLEENADAREEANEFESTIPYTPFDFAKQEVVSESTTGQKPEESDKSVSTDDFGAKEPPASFSPISMPSEPVGSGAHGSLEPKAISVQIFDPKESPSEQSADAQTLIKRDVPIAPPVEAPKQQTSPNIGREDTDGRNKVKLKPLDEGTVLNGRYEIVRKIGGGGMGAVYLASDRNLGGVLRAVKEMVQSYIEDSQQEKAVSDFKRESLLLTSLEHPAIPTIYDYFYDDKEGRFYLVMKYISGGDLSGRLRSTPEGKMDEASVTEWAIQIADVLDYLHNRQPPIIYRDLKPSNIMIDGNSGRAMLIDFGIARWVNKEEKGVTAVGTMGYAPPELFSGNVEPRSDIYSLGSTIFHLLTGADPQSNPLLIFDFNKNPRPRQINSRLSDQIEAILMQMVEYNLDRRFKSAAELRGLLTTHLENLKRNAVTFGVNDHAPAPVVAAMGKPPVSELVFCGFCGQKIMSTDVFCPFCGAQQPNAAAKGGKIEAPSYVAPKMTARLLIMATNELESPAFSLEKDTNLVGRRDPMSNIFPEVDLSKYDPQTKISRRHARIWRDRNSYMVEDLGSSNGTIIYTQTNEPLRLAKNQPHVLAHGDKIRIGDTTLHFVVN